MSNYISNQQLQIDQRILIDTLEMNRHTKLSLVSKDRTIKVVRMVDERD